MESKGDFIVQILVCFSVVLMVFVFLGTLVYVFLEGVNVVRIMEFVFFLLFFIPVFLIVLSKAKKEFAGWKNAKLNSAKKMEGILDDEFYK